MGALASDFLDKIDKGSTSFSYVKREGNVPSHLLARAALDFDMLLEWTRHIPNDVTNAFLIDHNKT